jgi:hypothetical protein
LPPENSQDAARRTISDLSSLATWSELPVDQVEAQARAEKAGDTPASLPVASETPTLRLRRSRDEDEATGEKESSESPEESGDRFDKWFPTKATIFDFTPPTLDEIDQEIADDAQRRNEAAASPSREADDDAEFEIDSASDEEEPESDDAEFESPDADHEREDSRATPPTVWSHSSHARNWSRARRRRSPLRLFFMIAFGGVVGLALGYYALLWIAGRQGDVLNLSNYLPSAILPREFRKPVIKLPANDVAITETIGAVEPPAVDEEPIDADPTEEDASEEDPTDEVPTEIEPPPAVQEESSASAATDGAAAGADIAAASNVAGAPSFSADELAVALSKAKEAQAGLVTGNFDDGAEVKRTKGQSYMAFTDLAQKATFVDKSSIATYASALEQEVQDLVRATLADAHAQEEVARLVPIWIKSAKRTHAGVFLTGRATNHADKGTVVECQLDLGSGEPVTVLVAQEQAESIESSGRPLAILGWIVDRPSENVHGYAGDAPQAVWAGQLISLE